MKNQLGLGFTFYFVLFLAISTEFGRAAESSRRVQPPNWSQDVLDAFFEDAREQLVGERPLRDAVDDAELSAAKPTSGEGPLAESELKWSALIEAETLTAEIKRIHIQLSTALRKSASFQGGGNLKCQRDFGLLAVLFGVIDQFDEANINQLGRWRRSAKLMQQRCLRTGQNCKAASAQSYAAAKETHAVLGELLRGQAPADETASQESDEPELVDRALLMQSMELAIKERMKPALANSREFRKRSQLAAEQSQLLAVLAEVIQQEGYEYADDDTYLDEARQLRQAARELADAAREKNYEAARAAAGQVGQSCSRCHEGYR
ncbi:MAG: cytochrome c [Planctomycetes bacterium]|nr:cytochrome c [Planctomycetota bacterium]